MTVSFYHQPADCASVRFNAAWLNLKNTSNCLEGEKHNGYLLHNKSFNYVHVHEQLL